MELTSPQASYKTVSVVFPNDSARVLMLQAYKCNVFSLLVLFLFALTSCEHAEKLENRTLVFQVLDSLPTGIAIEDGALYSISVREEAFLPAPPEQEQDSIFKPSELNITLTLLGRGLVSALENPNGFRVKTQLVLEGGTIVVVHTNQARLIVTEQGDSLYAVRGEGIISTGVGIFKDISGFFREVSTYRLEIPNSGQAKVQAVYCRYELTVDF